MKSIVESMRGGSCTISWFDGFEDPRMSKDYERSKIFDDLYLLSTGEYYDLFNTSADDLMKLKRLGVSASGWWSDDCADICLSDGRKKLRMQWSNGIARVDGKMSDDLLEFFEERSTDLYSMFQRL